MMRTFILAILLTGLLAAPAHAATYFDDEMEIGTTLFHSATSFGNGTFTYDTTIKFSGGGSIRLNYPAACEPDTFGGTGCGGAKTVPFPPTDEVYKRVYFRMSGVGANATTSGLFETSIGTFTKMLRTLSTGLQQQWWEMGCCRSKNWLVALENSPPGTAGNRFSNFTFADNRWYCIETREKMNTPGQPDGIVQSWVDGVLVLNITRNFRASGETTQWSTTGIFRQTGRGSIWFDRMAVGNTRIGCIGSNPSGDTTPPATPGGWTVQ